MLGDLAVKRIRVFICAAFLAVIPGQHLASPLVSKDMLNHLKSEYSDQAYRSGLAINRLLVELEGKDIQKQLVEVNRFFNQFEYQQDLAHWGVQDYWATPGEFLGTQQGDC